MNLVRRITATILFFSVFTVRSQSNIYPLDLPYLYAALYSKEVQGPYTYAFNPSTLPHLNGFTAGMYSEKRYMTKGLNVLILTAAYGTGLHGASIVFQHFGNLDFNERRIGLNYGKSLGNIHIGAIIHRHTFSITGNPTTSIINAGLSTLWHVSEKVFACMQISNPGIFTSGRKESLRAPTVFNMGFGFQVSQQVYTGLEIKKEEGRSMQSLFTLQYWPHDKIVTKLCWSTGNNQPYFTIGWMLNQFSIETGCSYHAALGITPSVSLIYSNVKKENIE